VAAVGQGILPGVEFDPARVGAEALFGAVFPIAPTKLNHAAMPTPVIDQRELLKRALHATEVAPTARVREVTATRLATMSEDQIKEMVTKGMTDDEVFRSLFANPEGRHVSEFIAARIDAITKLSELSEDTLRSAMETPGMQGVAAADALALKLKATRPVDAPAKDTVTQPAQIKLTNPSGDPIIFKTEAENAAIGAIRERTLPFRLEGIKATHAATRKAFEAMDAELAKIVSRDNLPSLVGQKDLPSALRPAPSPREIRPDFESSLRETMFPEMIARIKDINAEMGELRHVLTDLDPSSTRATAVKNRLTQLAARHNEAVDSVNGVLDGAVPPIVANAQEAKTIVQNLVRGHKPSYIKQLRQNLPTSLRPYEKELQPLFNKLTTQAFRSLSPVDRQIQNGIRKFRKEKLLTDPVELTPFEARELSGGDTLRGLQQRMSSLGGTIEPDAGGFRVKANDVNVRVKTLKAAREIVDDVLEDGTRIANAFSLDRKAARRFMSAIHIGDGNFKVVDHIQGTERVVSGPEKAAELVQQVPIRDTAAPELSGQQELGVPVASTGRRFSETNNKPSVAFRSPVKGRPTFEGDPQVFEPGLIKTTKNIFLSMEEALGDLPVFRELFDPFSKATVQRKQFIHGPMANLRKVLKDVQRDRMAAVQDTMLARGDSREAIAQHYNLNGAERRAIEQLENWYGKLLGINKEGVSELLEAMGKFRASGGSPGRLSDLGDFMLPRTLEAFRDSIQTGRFRPGGTNADQVAMSMLHEFANEKFGINALLANGKAMRSKINGRRNKAKGRDRDALELMSQEMNRFLSIVGDRSDLAALELSDGWQRVLAPVFQNMGKLFGDSQALTNAQGKVTRGNIDKMARLFTTWYSGVAMSGRLALAARNSFQSMLPGLKVGYKRNMAAIGDAFDSKNIELARKNGIITKRDGVMFLDELIEAGEGIGKAGSLVGKAGTMARELQKFGLQLYQGVDSFNRVVSYFSGRRAIFEEASKLGADPSGFLVRTGLAGDSQIVQDTVLSLVRNNQLEKAADFYGRHVMQDTQFIYRQENIPKFMGGSTGKWSSAGKLFGQFGTWPVSFWNYMRQNMSGINGTGAQRTFALQFGVRYATMLAGIGALGASLGIDTSTWNMGFPSTFEGGPAFQMLGDATNVITSPSNFQRQIAAGNLWRSVSEVPIPLGGLVGDLEQAGIVDNPLNTKEPGRPNDALRKFLIATGFNEGQGNFISAGFVED
jgi:hypothetical protein